MMHESTARLYQAAEQLRRIHHLPDLAQALAVSAQTVRNWEKHGLSKKGLQEARQTFGLSVHWLQTGEGEMLEHAAPSVPLAMPSAVVRSGLKQDALSETALQDWALQQLGLRRDEIRPLIVQNDNMLNTLAIGDTVLLRHDVRQYIGSGIYALNTAAGVQIYRINRFQNGFFVLINDNPAYPPEILRPDEIEQLQIIGRVVGKYGIVAL